jgi:hypothetical protein
MHLVFWMPLAYNAQLHAVHYMLSLYSMHLLLCCGRIILLLLQVHGA